MYANVVANIEVIIKVPKNMEHLGVNYVPTDHEVEEAINQSVKQSRWWRISLPRVVAVRFDD